MESIDAHKVASKLKLLDVFRKQGKHEQKRSRLPPGQRVTPGFPVLDLGIKPAMDLMTWKLRIFGAVRKELNVSLDELKKLGVQHYTKDFHCVTTWSKYDVKWTGIPFKKIIEFAQPDPNWKHVIQFGKDGYSTNAPRADIERDDAFLAFELDGKPIPREHGYVRLIIPHLYAWKTSKFLTAIEFALVDKPGYWETRGYHNRGNAMLEERYS